MNSTQATAMVFDLDGVLADARHRLHYLRHSPKDWDAFFGAASLDPVLPQGAELVALAVGQGHQVIYLTGRPERCRNDTEAWLADRGLPAGPLHMRRDGDRRPARFTKVASLRAIGRQMTIAAFVDDDAAVVQSVRAAGFPVIHATWMTLSTSTVELHSVQASDQAVLFGAQEGEGRT